MLLSYIVGFGEKGHDLELCLVPDKPDVLSKPVPVSSLFPTVAAVLRIGPDESVSITSEPTEGAIIVSGIAPATIYLTPNLPQSPGFKAKRIKIVHSGGEFRTFYDRDKGTWDEWIANRERA